MRRPRYLDIHPRMLPVGTVLRRWYAGCLIEVEIVGRTGMKLTDAARRKGWWRYRYKGKRYKTLSAIAREVTGQYYLSGHRFFDLRRLRVGAHSEAAR